VKVFFGKYFDYISQVMLENYKPVLQASDEDFPS
jgi:hypothetical protein